MDAQELDAELSEPSASSAGVAPGSWRTKGGGKTEEEELSSVPFPRFLRSRPARDEDRAFSEKSWERVERSGDETL